MFAAKVGKKGERHNGKHQKKIIIMQKQEFIELCKQYGPNRFNNLSDETYRKYETLYDELDNLDKQRFCELLMTDKPQLFVEAAKEISYWRGRAEDSEADKKTLANALAECGEYAALNEVYDTKTVIGMKLERGVALSAEELNYIKLNLK